MSGTMNQSPQVTLTEIDASQFTGGVATTIGCMTAAFKRGPMGPYTITSGPSFTQNYGPTDLSWGYGHITGLAFMAKAQQMLVNRVVDPATCGYASLDVFNATNPIGPGNYTFLNPGTNLELPYANANNSTNNQLVSINLVNTGSALQAGQTIVVTATVPAASGGTYNLISSTVTYTTSSDNTMQLIANAISYMFNNNTLAAPIPCSAAPVNATGAATSFAINVLFDLTSASVSSSTGNPISFSVALSGGGNASFTTEVNDLFQVFARDPGAYGNTIGISLSNSNVATLANISFTLTGWTSGHAFQLIANLMYNNTTYNISASGSTINRAFIAFVAEYTATFGGISNAYYSFNTSNTIISCVLFAPAYGNALTLGNNGITLVDLTAGGPQPSTDFSITVNAPSNPNSINSTNSFTLNVYANGSNTPVETFVCSLQNTIDGFGNQLYIEEVINTGTNSPPSNYIRVNYTGGASYPNGNVSATFQKGILTNNTSTPIIYLGGGQDGIQPSDSDIVNAINLLFSKEAYQFNIILNAGYTDVVVQQALANLAQTRQDSFAILDIPPNVQTPSSAAGQYASQTLGINSSYAAIFSPDLYILDTTNNQYIYVPPSGYVGGQFAITDTNFAVWFSAAGLKRGVLTNVVGLYTQYNIGDRNILATNNVCAIKPALNGSGIVIWDVLTLLQPRSLLSFISIRRTFIYLEQSIIQALEGYVFDNITQQTEFLITQSINAFLQPIQNQEGISNYYVLCDSINNPANDTDAGILNVTVFVVPVVPARIIALKAVVTPNSITFSELISQGIF